MKTKKLTTLALTGALALGGLGIGSMSDLPIPGMQAQEASAAGTHSSAIVGGGGVIWHNTLNAIGAFSDLEVSSSNTNFSNGEPRWIIRNTQGVVMKSGAMNSPITFSEFAPQRYNWRTTNTNISLAGLPNNNANYRIDFTWQASDKLVTKADVPYLTQAFTYNPDGSVTNIRD